MPPRRPATRRNASGTPQQSTLSFHGKSGRITKNTSPRNAKTIKADPTLAEDLATAKVKAEPRSDQDESPIQAQEKTVKKEEEEEVEDARALPQRIKSGTSPAPDPLDDADEQNAVKAEDVLGGRAPLSELGATGGARGDGWVGEEAQQARKITDTQIKRYWRAKEAERLAPRVHQQGLSVYEKLLREWDMSGQYGPCIGITRLKRWKRANALGLKPPIEVLAVLLKEVEGGETKSQRAYADTLLASRFVEV